MKTPVGFLLMMVVSVVILVTSLLPAHPVNSLALAGTATKTPTKRPVQTTRTPAGQAAIPIVHFDRLSTIVPADIVLSEITYGGAFGGPDVDISMQFTDSTACPRGLTKPIIVEDPLDRTYERGSSMDTCGWQQGQELEGRIISPDGSVFGEINTVVGGEGSASLFLLPAYPDPPGIYTYEIRGQGIVLRSNAYFQMSRAPKVSILSSNQFLLENFLPNETVRLFAFTCSGEPRGTRPCKLYGWANYKIPEGGQLIIQLSDPSMFYKLVDSYGYQFAPDLKEMRYRYFISTGGSGERLPTLRCPPWIYEQTRDDAINRLTKARVIADSPGIYLYANPRASARAIGILKPGQLVDVIDVGVPICNEGKVWWRVSMNKTANGVQGFIVEFDGSDFYTEPVKSP